MRFSALRFSLFIGVAHTLTSFASQALAQDASPAPVYEHIRPTERLTPETLPKFLESVRAGYGLPALGVAIVFHNKISVFTTGVRKVGDPTPVTNDDGWHLGSCTKSMTATLMGMLVDDGKLNWDSTLSAMLPDLAATMLPEYRDVTLRQLLSHRAGFPTATVPAGDTWIKWQTKTEPLPLQRTEFVAAFLKQKPAYPPGTQMRYSNIGYVVAGAIAERIEKKSWEDLIKERLFDPLGMTSVTFGTQTTDKPVEPWPHTLKDHVSVPALPGLDMEIPLVVGPCGLVRSSLGDWAKYAQFWMNGLRGQSDLLKPFTFQFLATPPDSATDPVMKTGIGDAYACGWGLFHRSWSAGTVYYHSGSNLKNYSTVWLAPAENFAVLLATNSGGGKQALDDLAGPILGELYRQSQN